jgi:Tfp pilus assembly protein PilF
MERIETWRDRLFDATGRITRKWLPDLAPPPDRGNHREAVATLERGRKAYNAKNYPRAEEQFRKAVLEDESYSKAHYYLGLALYKQNDSQGAARAWTRATEVDPTGAMGLKAARKLNYVKKRLGSALSELEGRISPKK